MYRPMMLPVLITVCLLVSPAAGQQSTRADFTDYGRVMDGAWVGRITLWQDIKDIGKKGDELTARWVIEVTQRGNALVGNGTDGKGTAASFYYYDVDKKQIVGTTVFNGGTVMSSVVVKRDDKTWERKNTSLDPDGTKSASLDTLVVSDGGNAHTWTRDGKANVWWRLPR